ncbi:hypothetical protein TUM18999_46850 [Pseudomonas tohonis]|uniref:Uncharacterized protein n=1 Tax=Pseudomonas tohonis TaxID=2725477 RepID=A0A6J4EBY6_9PSED|nr:hypothetical protein [Pseudomonas tohonis]BCG26494.1 hypothetical protein TUM18999_46850 [Pseudomonas tohonis]
MRHNSDGTVTFEVDDFVGDMLTGKERFGVVIEVVGENLIVSADGSRKGTWEVPESSVFPG